MSRYKSEKRRSMSQYLLSIPSLLRPDTGRADAGRPDGGTWAESASVVDDRDALLFERHLDGDDAAFVDLFNRHNHRLFVYCLKLVGSSDAAEDLTQELWEKVIRLRFSGSNPVHNPGGFFVRMARNMSLNYLRDHRRASSLDDLPESSAPADTTRERTEREEFVVLALANLSFDYREVLILNAYSGYSLEEIAVMLGKSVEAIWKRASRAREKLRKEVMALIEQQNKQMERMAGRGSGFGGGRND